MTAGLHKIEDDLAPAVWDWEAFQHWVDVCLSTQARLLSDLA